MKNQKKDKEAPEGPWLYGINPVMEALKAGRLSSLYVSSGRRRQIDQLLQEARARGVPVKTIHDAGYFDSRFPKGHQGVAGIMESARTYHLDDLLELPGAKGEAALFVLVDGIEDPRNLGAVLRSAEAAGVHGVVMEKRRSASIGPEAIKASAGAALHIPVAVVSNIKNVMRTMSADGTLLVGAEAGGSVRPSDVDLTGPVALVVGSEGRGLRRTVAEACDMVISLPIRGQVNSLNTSVAAGILIYEALRQRGL